MLVTKTFLDEDFLLQTDAARTLYHEFAKQMPIIDYHNHLPPDQIVNDKNFDNLTQIWLYGDHYKWRGMRANGIDESYCTGDKSDYQKFEKWAETVPYTLRNPLYHWTHLELQRYFDVHDILSPKTARKIYDECSEKLRTPDYSVRNLLRKMNVEVVCTTDDPLDSLEYHQQFPNTPSLKGEGWGGVMRPAFRPDKFILIGNPNFAGFIQKLAVIVGFEITSYDDLTKALRVRAHFFASLGCLLSDHGLEQLYAADFTPEDANTVFKKALAGQTLTTTEQVLYQSAILHYLGTMYHELGWTQQFHIGALRNNNSRALRLLGPDTGWDSIGDWSQAKALSTFLGRLDEYNQLAKTIIYNLNPADNEVIATMIGNFNDGSVAGKIQFGSGWWFMDQKDGMEKQMNALSNMGLLSRFVGMLTDSRSFLSFPRHEYFRRILCNMFGNDIENGELPNDTEWIGQVVQDICYNNAKRYFGF
ncbi:glucuronate isomerase [Runella slithyformis]|uniref:Uronate isomerase n=1 Tax=Runella slithyformis (strain ATCC 29530 / DSM 19594 / LMG 11500 / NCIMB 11436 / LSU 4) TaxID=761193 RepID=A0A7U3ZK50_RUNSL|nr:glucuronate isomerase [Runella slithyformis]AEI48695.1 Uronate isomerase [Runella slithyformis DSM 19594]